MPPRISNKLRRHVRKLAAIMIEADIASMDPETYCPSTVPTDRERNGVLAAFDELIEELRAASRTNALENSSKFRARQRPASRQGDGAAGRRGEQQT